MGVNSLPKTVARQRRGCDLNPGPSAPESSTLATRLSSHPMPKCHRYHKEVICTVRSRTEATDANRPSIVFTTR